MARSCIRDAGLLGWLHLIRVYNKIQHRSAILLRGYNLTPAQFDVLAHLSAAQGISQQALAERLLVTKGNVCGIIDRLEERRLMQRRSDPEDRRAYRLFLTDAGQRLAEEVVPAQEDLIKDLLACLSLAEQRQVHALLCKLDRAVDDDLP